MPSNLIHYIGCKLMRRINTDTLIAIVLILVGITFFIDTFYIRETPLAIVKSRTWPRIVLCLLFIFAGVYLFQSLKKISGTQPRRQGGFKQRVLANRNVFWCFGLFALFLLSLPWLGMLIGGGLFVFATLTAMGRNEPRSHLINGLVAVLSMGLMWGLFTFGLNVMLPQGEILRVF